MGVKTFQAQTSSYLFFPSSSSSSSSTFHVVFLLFFFTPNKPSSESQTNFQEEEEDEKVKMKKKRDSRTECLSPSYLFLFIDPCIFSSLVKEYKTLSDDEKLSEWKREERRVLSVVGDRRWGRRKGSG